MEECGGHPVPEAPAIRKAIPKFATLPSKYQLLEHPIYPRAVSGTPTLEDEYNKYKNGPLCTEDTDLVEFWNVSAASLMRLLGLNKLFLID